MLHTCAQYPKMPAVPSRAPNPARLRLAALLFAWCVATGAAWDLVQIFAWGRMWVGHLQTRTPAAALSATFAPDGGCELCHAVAAAKEQTTDTPAATPDKLLLLPWPRSEAPLVRLLRPQPHRLPPFAAGQPHPRAEPPTPPPRRFGA